MYCSARGMAQTKLCLYACSEKSKGLLERCNVKQLFKRDFASSSRYSGARGIKTRTPENNYVAVSCHSRESVCYQQQHHSILTGKRYHHEVYLAQLQELIPSSSTVYSVRWLRDVASSKKKSPEIDKRGKSKFSVARIVCVASGKTVFLFSVKILYYSHAREAQVCVLPAQLFPGPCFESATLPRYSTVHSQFGSAA